MAKKKEDPKLEMFKGLNREMDQIARDKGIDKMVVVEAVQFAFLSAGKKIFGEDKEIEAHYNEEDEEIELFEFLNVVENVADDNLEIAHDEALKHDPECEIGDVIGLKMNAEKLGRIAAQTAKQVIIQKIRDAETEIIFNEYKDRVGQLIAGIVRRMERRNLIVDLGRTEAFLPYSEQVPREHFRPGDRIQCYVKEINRTPRGAQIVISRAHEGLLTKLFENEVPEIYEGVVAIESAAREPGGRSKISVSTKDSSVDPVGACVGMKGSRVQAVVQELRGEKIDIVPFDADPARFVCNAIAPAEVSRVILDEKNHSMELIVADDQLSLAIGKKGQNVRLAAKLTGWKIDIHSETKMKAAAETGKHNLTSIEGLGENLADLLYNQGIVSPESLVEHSAEDIARITGLDEEKIAELQASAKEFIEYAKSQNIEMEDATVTPEASSENAEHKAAEVTAE
ncbi:MAG: transcription termination/antitermination protein NusA [Deltaproteobacteria bacterium]|nr:transcription termination/antitermination protein NusA [Deltaproteobacteria bacterium]